MDIDDELVATMMLTILDVSRITEKEFITALDELFEFELFYVWAAELFCEVSVELFTFFIVEVAQKFMSH